MLTSLRRRVQRPPSASTDSGGTRQVPTADVDTLNQAMGRASAEIARRSTTQQAVQASSVSASVALAGITVSDIGDVRLLLLIPMLSAAFGYQWLDQHQAIQRLGQFMQTQLEPELVRLLHLRTPLWETYLRQENRDRKGAGSWTFPTLTIFYGPALAALVLAAPSTWASLLDLTGASSWVARLWPVAIWAIGALLTLVGTLDMSRKLVGKRART